MKLTILEEYEQGSTHTSATSALSESELPVLEQSQYRAEPADLQTYTCLACMTEHPAKNMVLCCDTRKSGDVHGLCKDCLPVFLVHPMSKVDLEKNTGYISTIKCPHAQCQNRIPLDNFPIHIMEKVAAMTACAARLVSPLTCAGCDIEGPAALSSCCEED